MSGQISILTAKSQESVEIHLGLSGWKPKWRLGEPTKKYPNGEPLDDGLVEGKKAQITRIRSAEIPWQVSQGVSDNGAGFDVGLVGTDCFVDHPLENMYVMGAFLYGRSLEGKQPSLALFSKETSPIKTESAIRGFPVNALMGERPHLVQAYLSAIGIDSVIYGDEADYATFAHNVQKDGKVPIKIIEGAGAQQLKRDNDLLAMVRETGRRERNYNIHEVTKLCDIETLLLVNVSSYNDNKKRPLIDHLVHDLGAQALSLETEGFNGPKESFMPGIGAKER